jgi:hypothetical protein
MSGSNCPPLGFPWASGFSLTNNDDRVVQSMGEFSYASALCFLLILLLAYISHLQSRHERAAHSSNVRRRKKMPLK